MTILRIFYQYRPRFHTETRRADLALITQRRIAEMIALGQFHHYLSEETIYYRYQGKRILTILDKMNFIWVAYPERGLDIFE